MWILLLLIVLLLAFRFGLPLLLAFFVGAMSGRREDSSPKNPSNTMKPSIVLIASLLIVSLSSSGCNGLGGGASKTLPAAELNSQAIGEHVAASLNHIKTTMVLNNRTLSIMDDVQAGKVTIAVALPEMRQQIVQANVELVATQAELAATQQQRTQLDEALSKAVTEKAAETARADMYEDKYKNQWLAGKSWAAIWTIAIVGSLLLILAAFVNAQTDVFVLPFTLAVKTLSSLVGGGVKAVSSLFTDLWIELASLFKKKSSEQLVMTATAGTMTIVPPILSNHPITLNPPTEGT